MFLTEHFSQCILHFCDTANLDNKHTDMHTLHPKECVIVYLTFCIGFKQFIICLYLVHCLADVQASIQGMHKSISFVFNIHTIIIIHSIYTWKCLNIQLMKFLANAARDHEGYLSLNLLLILCPQF